MNLCHPQGFGTEELPNYLSGFSLSEKWINLLFLSHCFFYRRHVSVIEKAPPIPSTIWYYPQLRSTAPHLHCTVLVCYFFTSLWGRTCCKHFFNSDCSLLYSLLEDLSFCFRDHLRCHMLGRLVPICSLSKPAWRRLLLPSLAWQHSLLSLFTIVFEYYQNQILPPQLAVSRKLQTTNSAVAWIY